MLPSVLKKEHVVYLIKNAYRISGQDSLKANNTLPQKEKLDEG